MVAVESDIGSAALIGREQDTARPVRIENGASSQDTTTAMTYSCWKPGTTAVTDESDDGNERTRPVWRYREVAACSCGTTRHKTAEPT